MSTQTESQNADKIKEEVRQVIRRLTELSQTSEDFDQFCGEVLGRLVEITGAHGALFWQITGQGVPKLTHHSGKAPHDQAREILNPENEQHNRAILDVVRQKMPVGVMSEAFTGKVDQTASPEVASDMPSPFLMLFSPVLNRQKDAVGAVELVQRGDISPQAQEGYLRFLTQISALFQRWHERQDVAKVEQRSEKWSEKLEFISEVHRSIDFKETAYAIANESRRVLNADRVSVGRWNGRKCKILSISSQDRFDNRANVVRKLGNVATASVGADQTFWVTGSTDHIAPEVAKKINDYLDESHSRTLAVIPLAIRPPDVPDLDMNKQNKKVRKLGAIVLEYFDDDVTEDKIREDCQLVVEQSQLAMENARKHGEIFLQPVLKKLGWLQQTLFGDHFKKTMTGLAALTLLTLAMIFLPWELKMKVSGVLHPEMRRHVYATSKGIVQADTVNFKDGDVVEEGTLLMKMVDYDRNQQANARLAELERIEKTKSVIYSQLNSANRERQEALSSELATLSAQEAATKELVEQDRRMMSDVLEVRAPIDGSVITWDLEQRLSGYPVDPNQTLVTICQLDGKWQLEVDIPHNKVGYVDRALAVAREDQQDATIEAQFALSTNPSKTYDGQLERVSIRPYTDDSGIQKYRGTIKVDPKDVDLTELRPGAGATVKIHCGKVPLYKACFHQIIDWTQTNVWWF